MKVKTKEITLKDVIYDARRVYPDLDTITALQYYAKIQESIINYSQDETKWKEAFIRWNISNLIINAYEPDYRWQKLYKINYN
ncbi:MAG: hypothetical protein NZM09_10185 [Ignavibacterium sp.]|nr:hypothetical protein [Ignavibacterium sp.]MDW8376047.1 hypothetical protein [Ignavibacteriales bacterium]